jgi:hypothetical protein
MAARPSKRKQTAKPKTGRRSNAASSRTAGRRRPTARPKLSASDVNVLVTAASPQEWNAADDVDVFTPLPPATAARTTRKRA